MMDEQRLKDLIRQVVEKEVRGEEPAVPIPDFVPTAPRERHDSGLSPEDYKLAKKVSNWVGAELPTPPWHGSWRAAGGRDYFLSRTPARLGVGRAGTRCRTDTTLSFLIDHAAARDAVHSDISASLESELGLVSVRSAAADKREFLARPDLGRRLSDESREIVSRSAQKNPQVQIVAGDGLSATAINVNLPRILPVLEAELKRSGVKLGTTFAVSNARVACGDEIARIVDAEVLCMIVGERPGLKTAESMGVYVTYMKVKDFNEAMRSVVSNVHSGGLVPETDGAKQVAELCLRALKDRKTGVDMSS